MKPHLGSRVGVGRRDEPSGDEARLLSWLTSKADPLEFDLRRRGRHWIVVRRHRRMMGQADLETEYLRLTPLENGQFGLSVRRHDRRWVRLPLKGDLPRLTGILEHHLTHWWSLP